MTRDGPLLSRAAAEESNWSRRLVVCMALARLHLRCGRVGQAARALSLGVVAFRGLARLERQLHAPQRPAAMIDYVALCGHALNAFEPPVAHGTDPVAAIARLGNLLTPIRRAQPERTIAALDALVTIGHGSAGGDLHARVGSELARMLGARVLLHYVGGVYVEREAQDVHTLSAWAMRRLVADRRLVARKVRPRPEFWRPEQRRPRGVLTVPLGEGVVVLARMRRFRPEEVRAVRTVLRFLEVRIATPAHLPVPRAAPVAGDLTVPTVAEGLVGRSAAWRVVVDQVRRAAPSGCPIVLLGETGTGKERLARAIHSYSGRGHGAFVPVNCGALAPELLTSELFGHVRGAFTGADTARDGLFVQAHRGTLFLDEVADMPTPMQVALLRALEAGVITPVGSARPRPVDVRVVSATNVDLEERVRAGKFREDLWHRLNVFVIGVPPLRERIDDLGLLAVHMLARLPGQKELHPDALEVLARYRWPGNVRELENVLRAGSVLAEGPELDPSLMQRLLDSRRAALGVPPDSLPPRTRAVLDTLNERWLSTPEIARALGLSARTVNRELADLVHQGLVRLTGQARAARYTRAGSAWRDLTRSE
jgi:transcriptional regulator with AAA-type ATPase domain